MSSNRPEAFGRRDDSSSPYRADWTRAPSVSMAVIEAVADAENADPLELEPLNNSIDPDALDALFPSGDGPTLSPVQEVSIRYNGCHVTIHGSGELVVRPVGPTAGS